ncbi:uncharacterized protein LOC116177002 isoform X1 [Photinus pyralis]|uniref:uncharacterized protein LOC116172432 isoform X1 n=1 Tax=Photinus pyralis TaxID=7054 RepID=UPI0012675D66|nr:uncharacterized protein LOC116172432 isoform X1 [Photinus pyralis]XP_031351717.1 uncharacterized protein LOC116177002 isoform X1 [Photinus pyralis]
MKPVVSHLRTAGLLSVVYLDDFLLLGDSYRNCLHNVTQTTTLLESLGFIINKEKSCMAPQQVCEFLGFTINTVEMSIKIPDKKVEKLFKMVNNFSILNFCKIREFATLVGKLVSINPAMKFGWLHTRNFERVKLLALNSHGENYDATMQIPSSLKDDFEWWRKNLSNSGNSLEKLQFDLEIFSDASNTGWGVCCKGLRTHGHWSASEQSYHINLLELQAAFFGLKCFASNIKNKNIVCRIDNTTAIACINKMGSVQFPKLNSLTREIWHWCENRNIFIFASYIRSVENVDADRESRRALSIETEWELSTFAFGKICHTFGYPVIDLFASRLNKKCDKFISWFRDPEASEVNAFTVSWANLWFYAFPPFTLILKVLNKINADKAKGIVVVPLWPAQPWFPLFKSMLDSPLIIFEPNRRLLSFDRRPHPLWRRISLAVGILSGKP